MIRNKRNEILARMLTKKKISVVYSNAPTAFVDLEKNIITIPMFSNTYSSYVEDFMLFHEIFHIFFTPPAQYMKAQSSVDRNILNIVEDIRIEYLGRKSLPGIIETFHEACKNIAYETPLFQSVKTPDVFYKDCSLVKRISYYFRFGHIIKIPFAQEEIPLVVEASEMKTFRDAVDLAKKLQNQNNVRSFEQDQSQIDGADDDEEKDGDNPGVPEPSEIEPTKETSVKRKHHFEREQCFEDELKKFMQTQKTVGVIHALPEPYKFQNRNSLKQSTDNPFNNKMLNSLTQYFNMKKNSMNINNQRFQNTGGLDIRSLPKYKITDNIFKSNSVKNHEENHAFIGFVDYSGSMQQISDKVLKFIKLLSDFFDRVGVPYAFYGWGDGNFSTYNNSEACIIDIINSAMKKEDLKKRKIELENSEFGAGSTPLAGAVVNAIEQTEVFMKLTNADVTNAIWITDGDGDGYNHGKTFLPNANIWIEPGDIVKNKEIPFYINCFGDRLKTTAIHISNTTPNFFANINGKNTNKILINHFKISDPIYMKGLAKSFIDGII